jgi:cob(I)alamin adenosyltransferase
MRRAGLLGEARTAELSNTVRPRSGRHAGNVLMGNRLSKIYTRTGDDGSTGLGDGSRVPKDSPRVAAYGTTDELNSTIGMVLACDGVPEAVREVLSQVQQELFDLGGELCIPGMETMNDAHVEHLEQVLDRFNADLPRLKEFILPGGGMAGACCHLARTVCRRAERAVVTLAREDSVRPQVRRYLNRLSDLLFVLARVLARGSGHGEVLWQHERQRRHTS